jgi:hypothetical protein
VDLGNLEVGVDRRLHGDEVVVTAKAIEKRTQIGERHGVALGSGLWASGSRPPGFGLLARAKAESQEPRAR